MRGKVQRQRMHARARRITPAYAGKRRACWWTHRRTRDHPRVCGEKSKTKDTAAYTPGSPPHVRGKAGRLRGLQAGEGITPACAGKSTLRRYRIKKQRDHPRMCGEKRDCSQCVVTHLGSPPHVRGKVMALLGTFGPVRITPACAGKSTGMVIEAVRKEDHPRMLSLIHI